VKVGDLVQWSACDETTIYNGVGIITQLNVVKGRPNLCTAQHLVLLEGREVIIPSIELRVINGSR